MKKVSKGIVSTTLALYMTFIGVGCVVAVAAGSSTTTNTPKALYVLNNQTIKPSFHIEDHNSNGVKAQLKGKDLDKKSNLEDLKKGVHAKASKPVMAELNESQVKKALTYASKFKGVPYVFGGSSPRGFDCSGFLCYVFKNSLGIDLPRSADKQYRVGKNVSRKDLKPGDLVFFTTYTRGVSHSGIYIGNNKFISATSSAGIKVVDMNDHYWSHRYMGAKRLVVTQKS